MHFMCSTNYYIIFYREYRRRCSRYVFVIPFMQSGLQAVHISVSYMDEPSGVTQEEGDMIFYFFYIRLMYIAGASSNLLILRVETVTQFCVYQCY